MRQRYSAEDWPDDLQRLFEALDREDFIILCYDHFQEVYRRFSANSFPRQNVHQLIAYCQRNHSIDQLRSLSRIEVPHRGRILFPLSGVKSKKEKSLAVLLQFMVAGAIIVFLIAIFVFALPNQNIQDQLFLSLGLLPFEPAASDENLIVVATFYRTEGVPDNDIHNEIKNAMQIAANEYDFINFRVEIEPTPLRTDLQEEAERLAHRYRAGVIIWGENTGTRVTVNYLNLGDPAAFASEIQISETERSPIANPTEYVRFVTEDLPGQLTFYSFFGLGQSYFKNGEYLNAITAFEAGIAFLSAGESQPKEGLEEAYFYLGWLYQVHLEDIERAKDYYEQSILLAPNSSGAYYNLGNILFDSGDFTQAIVNYTHTISRNLNYGPGYVNRGLAYAQADASEENLRLAIKDFSKGIELGEEVCRVYYSRGFAYFSLAEVELALSDFGKAIELDKVCVDAYYLRGIVYTEDSSVKDLAKALADFDQVIRLDQAHFEAYIWRGRVKAERNNLQGAIADFSKAIDLNPNYAEAYYWRGSANIAAGKFDDAISDLTKAIDQSPNYAEAYLELGYAYYEAGKRAEAIINYDKAIGVKPDYADAYVFKGVVLTEDGKPDEALFHFNEAIKIKPHYAGAYYERGRIYVKDGPLQDLENAAADFNEVIRLNPEHVRAHFELGYVYEKTGDLSAAIDHLETYLELAPGDEPDREEAAQKIKELRSTLQQ